MVNRLGDDAAAANMNNVAFLTRFLSGDLNACLEILINTQRIPEAAFFARTYLPSQISRVVQLWKTSLSQVNAKAGQSLADPAQYDNLFPGLADALKTEQFLEQRRQRLPASACSAVPNNWERRPVDEMHLAEQQDQFHHVAPVKLSAAVEEKEMEDPSEDDEYESPAAPATAPIFNSSSSQQKNLLDDDVEDFQSNHPPPGASVMQPQVQQQPARSSNQPTIDPDLELDLENLELDDNVDTSEVNLDDDLLDDWSGKKKRKHKIPLLLFAYFLPPLSLKFPALKKKINTRFFFGWGCNWKLEKMICLYFFLQVFKTKKSPPFPSFCYYTPSHPHTIKTKRAISCYWFLFLSSI